MGRALVTGAASGIGRAVARNLAHAGWQVALLGRSIDTLSTACADLPSVSSGAHAAVVCDVGDASRVAAAFAEAEAALEGGCSCVVNAAGITASRLLLRTTDAEIDDVLRTNLLGSIYIGRAAARSMMRQKTGGAIINIGSVVGSDGHAGQAVYSASKSGVAGLTKSMAKELGSRGVRVNTVEPGFIASTGMTDGALLCALSLSLSLSLPLNVLPRYVGRLPSSSHRVFSPPPPRFRRCQTSPLSSAMLCSSAFRLVALAHPTMWRRWWGSSPHRRGHTSRAKSSGSTVGCGSSTL